jgi:hypothetical protein
MINNRDDEALRQKIISSLCTGGSARRGCVSKRELKNSTFDFDLVIDPRISIQKEEATATVAAVLLIERGGGMR